MSDVRGRIEAHAQRLFKGLHRNGNGTLSFNCPAHDDKRASGSLSVGKNGRPLLTCHAGCTNRDIAHALGFKTDAGLYAALDGCSDGSRRLKPRTLRNVVLKRAVRDRQKQSEAIPASELLKHPGAEFVYRDKKGEPKYKEVRYEHRGQKTIRVFTANGNGKWTPGLAKNVPRVPYRLDKLQGRTHVWWVEGGKCVAALKAIGLCASTSVGGAKGLRAEHQYAQQLADAGVERLTVLPDNDEPGGAYADQMARECLAVGIKVKVVVLPGLEELGDDIVDWLAAGHTKNELLQLRREAPWFTPADGLLKRLSDVAAEKVEWFWYTFIPLGKALMIAAENSKTGRPRTMPVISAGCGHCYSGAVCGPDGKKLALTAHVFGNEDGEEVDNVKTAWRAACRRANIEGLNFHDLRRECGSRWLEGGVGLLTVSALLGHAQVTTTNTYLASSPAIAEEELRAFEERRGNGLPNLSQTSGDDPSAFGKPTEAVH